MIRDVGVGYSVRNQEERKRANVYLYILYKKGASNSTCMNRNMPRSFLGANSAALRANYDE